MNNFIKAEKLIVEYMKIGTEFIKDDKKYRIVKSGKPKPSKGRGECKTDIYVLAQDEYGTYEEIKISYKKLNADFLENKITTDRAKQILGDEYQKTIIEEIDILRDKFESRILICKEKHSNTDKGAITLGWRYELTNKTEGKLSGKAKYTREQVLEVYKGMNLEPVKRDAKVNGEVIIRSGVADYILVSENISCAQDVIDQMQLIEDYVTLNPEIYFVCKAVNFLSLENKKKKWEGDRALSVTVEWSNNDNKLMGKLNFSNPLSQTANESAEKLMKVMKELGIETTHDIKSNNVFNIEKVYGLDLITSEDRGNITQTSNEEGRVDMKTNERGRGKFKPAPDYNIEDVRKLLIEKINEEKSNFSNCESTFDYSRLKYNSKKMNVISLFSGCGGLDLGFELAGLQAVIGEEIAVEVLKNKEVFFQRREESIFKTIYANDNFKEANQSYAENFPKDVYIDNSDIRKIKEFPKADIVLGGFPCPGFSEAGPRLIDDERNFLYLHFIRCLLQSQPLIFVAENVKGMMTLGKGEVFKQIVEDFKAAGYTVYNKLLNSRDYGVPQIRERVILVGVRNDLDFKYEFPKPTHGESESLKPFVTLEDAIGDLRDNTGEYFTGSYSTIYMSRNRKKNWNEQSFTIQASGRQAPIHPDGAPMENIGKDKWIFPDGEENNRRLSVKEIKRIQMFPDWFYLSVGKNDGITYNGRLDKKYKQVGNAVPVFLARAVAKPIADWAIDYKRDNNEINSEVAISK